MIIKELQKNQVFEEIPVRKHPSFHKPVSIIHAKSTLHIIDWVVKHLENHYLKISNLLHVYDENIEGGNFCGWQPRRFIYLPLHYIF